MRSAQGAPDTARLPIWRAASVWVLLCIIILLVNLGGVLTRQFPDPDDMLRLVQVRDLLAGQGWFDLHQHRIGPDGGTLMHWSRLVDIPIAAMILLLTPLLGSAGAEQVTLILLPLLTLAAILAVVARIAYRFFNTETLTLACLCLGLSPLLVAQVQPLRLDHHGWQVFSVMLALTGLLPGKGTRGATLAGLALAAGLSISLEVLPIAAGFGAVFGLRWLRDVNEGKPVLGFLAALTAGLAGIFLATRGLSDLALHCDIVTPAYLGLFAVTTLVTGAGIWLRPANWRLRAAVLVLAGAAGAATCYGSAPHCLAGPFADLDPLVRQYWYLNVLEGRPFWEVPLSLSLPVVLQGLVMIAALAQLWRSHAGAVGRWWGEYLLVAAASLLTGMLVWRSLAFVGALSAVPLGWLAARLLKRLRETSQTGRKLAVGLAVIVILMPGFPVTLAKAVVPRNHAAMERVSDAAEQSCQFSEQMEAMNALPAATIFAPLDVGPSIVELTHHSVVATGHHRAMQAMHDVIATFTGPTDAALPMIQHYAADYVLVCTQLVEPRLFIKEQPGSFTADLAAGNLPDWLEPVDIPGEHATMIWRVKN